MDNFQIPKIVKWVYSEQNDGQAFVEFGFYSEEERDVVTATLDKHNIPYEVSDNCGYGSYEGTVVVKNDHGNDPNIANQAFLAVEELHFPHVLDRANNFLEDSDDSLKEDWHLSKMYPQPIIGEVSIGIIGSKIELIFSCKSNAHAALILEETKEICPDTENFSVSVFGNSPDECIEVVDDLSEIPFPDNTAKALTSIGSKYFPNVVNSLLAILLEKREEAIENARADRIVEHVRETGSKNR